MQYGWLHHEITDQNSAYSFGISGSASPTGTATSIEVSDPRVLDRYFDCGRPAGARRISRAAWTADLAAHLARICDSRDLPSYDIQVGNLPWSCPRCSDYPTSDSFRNVRIREHNEGHREFKVRSGWPSGRTSMRPKAGEGAPGLDFQTWDYAYDASLQL